MEIKNRFMLLVRAGPVFFISDQKVDWAVLVSSSEKLLKSGGKIFVWYINIR